MTGPLRILVRTAVLAKSDPSRGGRLVRRPVRHPNGHVVNHWVKLDAHAAPNAPDPPPVASHTSRSARVLDELENALRSPDMQARIRAHLHLTRDLTPLDVLRACGIPNGAHIIDVYSVEATDQGFRAEVNAQHAAFGVDDMLRKVVLIFGDFGVADVENEHLLVREDFRGQGVGAALLANQVGAMDALGFDAIRLTAARVDHLDYTGYRVWPRLGFDGTLPDHVRRRLSAARGQALPPDVVTVRDVLMLPGGNALWREHGATVPLSFDVSPYSADRDWLQSALADRPPRVKIDP